MVCECGHIKKLHQHQYDYGAGSGQCENKWKGNGKHCFCDEYVKKEASTQ